MATFARPVQDISRGNWVTHTGATTNLFATIDEEVADDNDYVICPIGANTAYEVRLSSVAPAVIARDHTLFLRGRKDQANGNQKGVDVSLVQGTTILGTQSFPNLPATVTQQSITLPRAMVSLITDYADLRLRFTPTGITTGGSSRRRVVILGAALRVPSAIDLVDDLLIRWGVVEDTSTPGVVRLSHSGFTGEGPNRSVAIWRLFGEVKSDPDFYFANQAEIDRRFDIAYGLWKVIGYSQIRDDIVAGTYALPAHQTQTEAIAICDDKITRFIANAKAADMSETA